MARNHLVRARPRSGSSTKPTSSGQSTSSSARSTPPPCRLATAHTCNHPYGASCCCNCELTGSWSRAANHGRDRPGGSKAQQHRKERLAFSLLKHCLSLLCRTRALRPSPRPRRTRRGTRPATPRRTSPPCRPATCRPQPVASTRPRRPSPAGFRPRAPPPCRRSCPRSVLTRNGKLNMPPWLFLYGLLVSRL